MNTFQKIGISCIFAASVLSCSIDERVPIPQAEGSTSLTFISDPLSQFNVGTKASDIKTEEEKRINNLHIFFFDSDGSYLTGGYLSGYPDASTEGGYYSPGQGVTSIKIDNDNFTAGQNPGSAIIYAIANVEEDFFKEKDEYGRPVKVTNLSDLESLSYPSDPDRNRIFLELPQSTGMPMAAKETVDLTGSSNNNEGRTIELKALMARIDVNLTINSEQTDQSGRLPSFTMVRWKALNLPAQTKFGEQGFGIPTSGVEVVDESVIETQTANNTSSGTSGSSISLSFYMFENLQGAKDLSEVQWPEGSEIDSETGYPDGVYDQNQGIDRRQNYKPLRGKDTASSAAVQLVGYYSTYNSENNNATYLVRYTLYLGSNHTDNFEVKRNHQYKNDITVKGLISNDQSHSDGGNENYFTFDARVNIDTEVNKYYISILRERNHDAHFCVTPMDVYLFKEENSPKVVVRLDASADTPNGIPWLRMEKISAEDMENGTVSASGFTAYSDGGSHLATGTSWTAGNGKRAFFTTDLVTHTLKNNTEIEVTQSRDRIYFYIDENLSDSEDRTASVHLDYYENGSPVSSRTVLIGQTHFLPLVVHEDNEQINTDQGIIRTIYMEQYEEYLDHYDPLDRHNEESVFAGLPWMTGNYASKEIPELYKNRADAANLVSESNWGHPWKIRHYGFEYTNFIVSSEVTGQGVMTLNDSPKNAFQYCHNRNKRQSDGSVPDPGFSTTILGRHYPDDEYMDEKGTSKYSKYGKWFLPGIAEMEQALISYYLMFEEFQHYYYWSSSAAEVWGKTSGQQINYARATKVISTSPVGYAQSGGNYNGTGTPYLFIGNDYGNNDGYGGYALRSENRIRIRAFRIDLEPYQYY